jgi:hypothetical protein
MTKAEKDRLATERASAFRTGMADAIAGRPPLQRDSWDVASQAMYRDGYRIVGKRT